MLYIFLNFSLCACLSALCWCLRACLINFHSNFFLRVFLFQLILYFAFLLTILVCCSLLSFFVCFFGDFVGWLVGWLVWSRSHFVSCYQICFEYTNSYRKGKLNFHANNFAYTFLQLYPRHCGQDLRVPPTCSLVASFSFFLFERLTPGSLVKIYHNTVTSI